MGFLDRLFGRTPQNQQGYQQPSYQQPGYQQGYQQGVQPRTEDQQAIARYRYLLRTAPPETIEQAHQEAFASLTPEQRRQVLADMSKDLPASERPTSDDPTTLARTATRAELRQPGFMERTFGGGMGAGMGMGRTGGGMFGGGGGGMGMGGMIMGSMLGSIAGAVIGTTIAESMMDGFHGWDRATDGGMNEHGLDGDQQAFQGQDGDLGGGDPNGQGFDMGGGDGFSDGQTQDASFGGDTFGDTGGGFDSGFDGGFDMGGGDGF